MKKKPKYEAGISLDINGEVTLCYPTEFFVKVITGEERICISRSLSILKKMMDDKPEFREKFTGIYIASMEPIKEIVNNNPDKWDRYEMKEDDDE